MAQEEEKCTEKIMEKMETGGESLADSERLSSIEEENRRLREENERLRQEEERIRNLPPKERLYEKIHVSLRTMNLIVGALFVILAVVMVVALLDR